MLIAVNQNTSPPGSVPPVQFLQGIGIISAVLPVTTLEIDVYTTVIADIISASAFPTNYDVYVYGVTWALVLNQYENDLSLRKEFAGLPPSYNFGRVTYGFSDGVSKDFLWNYSKQVFPSAYFTISNRFGKVNAGVPIFLPPTQYGLTPQFPATPTCICVGDTCRVFSFADIDFRYSINYTVNSIYASDDVPQSTVGISII